jgi:hypothetical protein
MVARITGSSATSSQPPPKTFDRRIVGGRLAGQPPCCIRVLTAAPRHGLAQAVVELRISVADVLSPPAFGRPVGVLWCTLVSAGGRGRGPGGLMRRRIAGVLAVSAVAFIAAVPGMRPDLANAATAHPRAAGVGRDYAARRPGSGGRWGRARPVPGMGLLPQYGHAGAVWAISCPVPGSCTAGGSYAIGITAQSWPFAVTETRGRWQRAVTFPGIDAGTTVSTVSCASPGDCVAGGTEGDMGLGGYAFVVSQVNGRWRHRIVDPLRGLDEFGSAIYSSSCPAPGQWSVGGVYAGDQVARAVVVTERGARWPRPAPLPGLARLDQGRDSAINAVSCPAAGACAAAGYYTDARGHHQAFVVSERAGRWGPAVEVPGTGALNTGRDARVLALSCSSPGSCAAAGYYSARLHRQAFVASERDGTWANAVQASGTAALNGADGSAELTTLSCAARNCSAGGFYVRHHATQALVISQRHGAWGKPAAVPGAAKLNTGGDARVLTVSCAAPGTCSAGGYYSGPRGGTFPFVTDQTRGKWGRATTIAGVTRNGASSPLGGLNSLSCPAPSRCTGGGSYVNLKQNAIPLPFTVTQH